MATQFRPRTVISLFCIIAVALSIPAVSGIERSLGGNADAAFVQPFVNSIQASGAFVNEATPAPPPVHDTNFESSDMSSADKQEIIGSLQPRSSSVDADSTVNLNTSMAHAQDREEGGDSSEGSRVVALSVAAVAGVMCIGAAIAVHRQRRWQALQSPGTPPEASVYHNV